METVRDSRPVLVVGRVTARAEHLDDALALSLEHVRRSRQEPGCLSHAVHQDVEEPLRLVFVERWASAEALAQHFALPESNGFVAAMGKLASGPPSIQIFDGNEAISMAEMAELRSADAGHS